jgi:hypothetical protein
MATLDELHPRLVQMITMASQHIETMFPLAGRVAAMWHYVKSDGDHVVLLAPPVEKDLAAALMRQVFEAEEAVAVLYVDEAWTFMTTDPQAAADHLASGKGAEQHPDRIEVVMFNAEDETGNLMGVRRIERPPGEPPRLGPLELETWTHSHGRMVGMIPRGKRTLQ